jgi:hypothetical protein
VSSLAQQLAVWVWVCRTNSGRRKQVGSMGVVDEDDADISVLKAGVAR